MKSLIIYFSRADENYAVGYIGKVLFMKKILIPVLMNIMLLSCLCGCGTAALSEDPAPVPYCPGLGGFPGNGRSGIRTE